MTFPPRSKSITRPVALLGVFLALTLVSPALQAQPKIATVDLKQVFEKFFKTKQADTVLEANAQEAKKVLEGMYGEHKKSTEDYKRLIEGANDQAVSSDQRDKRKKSAETKLGEIKELEKNITQYSKQADTSIKEQQARLRDGIVEEIRGVITGIAKAGGFALVLDVSGESVNNRNPLVLFADTQYDLTAQIIGKLNEKAPAGILNTPNKTTNNAKDDKAPVNSLAPALSNPPKSRKGDKR